MLRILNLDWSKVTEKEKPVVTGRLLRYIAAHGGMISEDKSIFCTEDLDREKGYNILSRLFKLNNIAVYERVNAYGFDGSGRVF